jgi:hypothetical protein
MTEQLNAYNQEVVDKLFLLSENLADQMNVEDMEKDLWEWLVAGIAPSERQYETPVKRSDLIFFYEKVKEVLLTVYALSGND